MVPCNNVVLGTMAENNMAHTVNIGTAPTLLVVPRSRAWCTVDMSGVTARVSAVLRLRGLVHTGQLADDWAVAALARATVLAAECDCLLGPAD